MAYEVTGDEEGAVQLVCDAVEGGALYPEEVSAYILAELLSSAQAYLGRPVEKAVISVPAYFNSEQREATIEAGRLAGLETVRLIRCACKPSYHHHLPDAVACTGPLCALYLEAVLALAGSMKERIACTWG